MWVVGLDTWDSSTLIIEQAAGVGDLNKNPVFESDQVNITRAIPASLFEQFGFHITK
jgi:hypothetical protein